MTGVSTEFSLISAHYGNRVAERSKVPLMNHINEGIVVLNELNANNLTRKAFCLHPLLQNDEDLKEHYNHISNVCDAGAVLLAMEYRSVANEYLSDKINTNKHIRLSPLREVNQMLIADKVQNYKDFVIYHKGSHSRSRDLEKYFKNWFNALKIDNKMYERMCIAIDKNNEEYARLCVAVDETLKGNI